MIYVYGLNADKNMLVVFEKESKLRAGSFAGIVSSFEGVGRILVVEIRRIICAVIPSIIGDLRKIKSTFFKDEVFFHLFLSH